jgi:hypothetical protein
VEGDVQRLLIQGDIKSPLEREFRIRIDTWLQGRRTAPIRPLHWPLEFPEVMRRGGFDAVVSNPPFIGGKKVSGALGTDYREYLKQHIARDKPGNADLCSYFLLRDLSIARSGRVGIIATNTIAQGDTREVGLDQVVDMGWAVYRAEKSRPWPGTASLEVSLLWTGHRGEHETCILDGDRVAGITPSLDPQSRIHGNPYRLTANADQSFQGAIVLGTGFILEPDEAQSLIVKDPRNKAVLFPYLNGEDLNSRWDCSARRWVIDFNDWPIERAMEYQDVFAIIDEKVRPERQRTRPDGSYVLRNPLPQRWWQYADKRPALRKAVANLDRVLVVSRVTKYFSFALVSRAQVCNERLAVFASPSNALLCVLSCGLHEHWALANGTTQETRPTYFPEKCFETFPQPRFTGRMEHAGKELDKFRREVMGQRTIGLTDLYNLVHQETMVAVEIERLREIYVEIDQAVREAYSLDEEREPAIRQYEKDQASVALPSWREIELGHGFHETRQGIRFTISAQARADVLDKLLALNHYRYEQEGKQGLHSGKGRGASRKRGAGHAPSRTVPVLDDGGLFPPEGTLF